MLRLAASFTIALLLTACDNFQQAANTVDHPEFDKNIIKDDYKMGFYTDPAIFISFYTPEGQSNVRCALAHIDESRLAQTCYSKNPTPGNPVVAPASYSPRGPLGFKSLDESPKNKEEKKSDLVKLVDFVPLEDFHIRCILAISNTPALSCFEVILDNMADKQSANPQHQEASPTRSHDR